MTGIFIYGPSLFEEFWWEFQKNVPRIFLNATFSNSNRSSTNLAWGLHCKGIKPRHRLCSLHLNIWRHKFVENHKFVELWKIVTLMLQICDSTTTKLWRYTKKVHNFVAVESQICGIRVTIFHTSTNLWFSSNLCRQMFRYNISPCAITIQARSWGFPEGVRFLELRTFF